MSKSPKRHALPEVQVVHPSYQPSQAERVEAVLALVWSVHLDFGSTYEPL